MHNAPYYDQINAYLKGALSPEDRAPFEQALQTDSELAAELDFQRSLKAAAERHAAQAEAKDIMAQLRSEGIFEDAARQAERDRQLLESAQGDRAAINRLLAEHPSLADWRALDPEGFEEVVKASTPVRVVPMWVWARRVAAAAAVFVLGWVGYYNFIVPKWNTSEIVKKGASDSIKNQQKPMPEEDVIAEQEPALKPGEDKASKARPALPTLSGASFAQKAYSKPNLTARPPSELVSAGSDFEPETVIAMLNKGRLSEARRALSGCDETDCLYLLGHIFFQEARYDSAAVYFEEAWQNRRYGMTFLTNRYQDNLEYYRALALLGADSFKEADAALEAIAQKPGHPYVASAKSLLEKIRTAQLRTGMRLIKSGLESLSLSHPKAPTNSAIDVVGISLAMSKTLEHSFFQK